MFRLASLFVELSAKADPLNNALKGVHSNLSATSNAFNKMAKMGGAGIAGSVNVLSTAIQKLSGTSLSGVAKDIALVSGAAGSLGGGGFARGALGVSAIAGAIGKLSGGGEGGGAPAAAQSITGLMGVFSRLGGSADGAIRGIFGITSSFAGAGSAMAASINSVLGVVRAFGLLANLIPGVGQAISITTTIVTTLGQVMTTAVGGVFKFGESFLKFGGILVGSVVNGVMQVVGAITKLAGIVAGGIISSVEALAGALGRLAKATIGPALIAGAAGLAALGYGINRATNAASALHESMSKIGVVFADQTSTVMTLVDKLADSFGLPRRAMVDAASMFGMIASGAGASQKEAAKLSTAMTQLAADAMSFQNAPLDVALEKIRAGLVGESEPLRAWGVMLTEEAVALEGVRMGLAKTGKELTTFEKITARASLITRGLAPAVGDLDRTFADTENQMRRLGGNIENTLETIGKVFLPLKTQFASLASGTVDKLREAFQRNLSPIKSFLEGVSERLGRFHTLMTGVFESTGLKEFVTSAARGFMQFGASLERAILRGPELFRLFRDAFTNAVGPLATSALGALGIKFTDMGSMASNALAAVELGLRNLPEYAQIAGLMIQEKFQQASTIFWFVADTAKTAGQAIVLSFQNATSIASAAIGAFAGSIYNTVSTVASVFSHLFDSAIVTVHGLVGNLGVVFSGLGQVVTSALAPAIDILKLMVKGLMAIGGITKEAGQAVIDGFTEPFAKLKNIKFPELPNQNKAIQAVKDQIAANEALLKIERERSAVMAGNKAWGEDFLGGFPQATAKAVSVAQAAGKAIEKALHPKSYGIAEWAKENVAKQLAAITGVRAGGTAGGIGDLIGGLPGLPKNTLTKELERASGREIKGLDPERLRGLRPFEGAPAKDASNAPSTLRELLDADARAEQQRKEQIILQSKTNEILLRGAVGRMG